MISEVCYESREISAKKKQYCKGFILALWFLHSTFHLSDLSEQKSAKPNEMKEKHWFARPLCATPIFHVDPYFNRCRDRFFLHCKHSHWWQLKSVSKWWSGTARWRRFAFITIFFLWQSIIMSDNTCSICLEPLLSKSGDNIGSAVPCGHCFHTVSWYFVAL